MTTKPVRQMPNLVFEIPTYKTSKSEEIELVMKLADQLSGHGSYLSQLFSSELIEWYQSQVLGDSHCNIAVELHQLRQQNSDLIETNLKNEATIKALTEVINNHEEDAAELRKTNERLYNQLQDLRDQLHRETASLASAVEKISNRNTELEAQLVEAQTTLGMQDIRVLQLKAEIYDMQHPGQH